MKFLCLIHLGQTAVTGLSPRDKYILDIGSMAHNADLERRGHFVLAQALEPPESAVTLRSRHGQISITDGPYAETREHLGGVLLIEASDHDEAVAIAAEMPLARLGAIEVRPVVEIEPVAP